MPPILVLHFKRFAFSSTLRKKLGHDIQFPKRELDMGPFLLPPSSSSSASSVSCSLKDCNDGPPPSDGPPLPPPPSTSPRPALASPAALGGSLYQLFGVVNHMGGMEGGHYTAYARNCLDGQWYEFDDSRVSKVSESSIGGPSTYILFYRLIQ